MAVPMLDLRAQYAQIKADIDAAVANVFEAQQFRGGPVAEQFEQDIAQYLGVRHALGVSSGTDALYLALKAIGLKSGEEVIVPTFTFFATAGAVVNAGGTPVFADIEPDTFNVSAGIIESLITARTRAIIPVHLYGQCADMDPILELASAHNLFVMEDLAQALGATYHGNSAGRMGHLGAISFYPTKNLGAAGEGGMIVTNDDKLAHTIRLLRCHGMDTQYVHSMVGTNSHLHAIQAAVLDVKLKHLDSWNDKRRAIAQRYTEQLNGRDGLITPVERPDNRHIYHQYVIRVKQRDALAAHLRAQGIGCGIFYPVPLHRQQCFATLHADDAAFPVANQACTEVLALPVYPELTDSQQDEVINAIHSWFNA